jgi:hypothetical protein
MPARKAGAGARSGDCLARRARGTLRAGKSSNRAKGGLTMNKAVFIAVASALAIAGCASMEDKGRKVQCDVGPVSVSVTGKIVGVNLDPIPVLAKNQSICWQLDAAAAGTYMFFDESITINDTDNEFDDCKTGNKKGTMQGDSLIACKDKNNKHGEKDPRYYKYWIELKRRDGGPNLKSYDPQIGND